MNINVHIDRLILDGIDVEPSQKKELKVAVETELSQQLVNLGIGSTMQSNNNHQSVEGGSFSIENVRRPTRLGQQIGNAVYKGVGK